MKLILTGPAKRDIDAIWLHIARVSQDIQAAEQFVARLENTLRQISDAPGIGVRCADVDPEGFRAVDGNYLIYYRVWKKRVAVVRVIHGSRDQRKALRQVPGSGSASRRRK